MRPALALSLMLTALVAGVGASVAVLVEWSRMTTVPEAISPALWAARAYLAYFDFGAVAAFLPCRTLCRWMCAQLDPGRSHVTLRPTLFRTGPGDV